MKFLSANVSTDSKGYMAKAVCPFCGNSNSLRISKEVAHGVVDYLDDKIKYLQDIPTDKAVREFLKTGYCLSCQSMIFGYPSEEAIAHLQEK